jgi:hypothetical protein
MIFDGVIWWTAATSDFGLRNDHAQLAALRLVLELLGRSSGEVDETRDRAPCEAVSGGRHFMNLAGNADYKIEPGGFQQNALQRLTGAQPRPAV